MKTLIVSVNGLTKGQSPLSKCSGQLKINNNVEFLLRIISYCKIRNCIFSMYIDIDERWVLQRCCRAIRMQEVAGQYFSFSNNILFSSSSCSPLPVSPYLSLVHPFFSLSFPSSSCCTSSFSFPCSSFVSP